MESFGFVPEAGTEIFLVIDRFKYEDDETFLQRLADSIQMAFYEGKGYCSIKNADNGKIREFSNKYELDDIVLMNLIFIFSALTILMVHAPPVKVTER